MHTSDDAASPQPPAPARALSRVIWVLLFLAALQVGRAAVNQNVDLLDLDRYSHYEEKQPFQNRLLMAPVLRTLGENPEVLRLYNAMFVKSVRTPKDFIVEGVDCLSMLVLQPVTVLLRRDFGPRERSSWLAPLLMLLIVTVTFIVRYEQSYTMPYDFLSMLLFNLGLLAILRRQGWLLLILLAIAIPNRETAVFLVPVWFWMQWREGRKVSAVAYSVAGVAIFLALRSAIARFLHADKQPYDLPWKNNVMSVLLPPHWPQLLSVFGYLAAPMWMLRGEVRDEKLKALWVALLPMILAALVVGIWRETRIFGELSAVVAVTFAIQLEQIVPRGATAQPLEA
jgi:hypothetical protein